MQKDKDFKEALGAFIIEFSKLEFGLAYLCAMTDFDLRFQIRYVPKYMSFAFEKKVSHLAQFISEYVHEAKSVWDELHREIKELNRERRFLVHGFKEYSLPKEHIATHVKENGKVVTKRQTVEEIRKLTERIRHLNTGKNGINGEFHIYFFKTRVNQWNHLVNDDAKIVYTVNDEIVSDWKGAEKANA